MVRGPSRDVTRQDVLDTMAEIGVSREPFTSRDLAEHLPVSKDTVYNRLRELLELDEINSAKVGARARVWWRASDVDTKPPALPMGEFSGRDSRVLGAMQEATRDGAAITSSVIESKTGIDSNIVYKRLNELAEQGWVNSKKVGANARVWWLPSDPPIATGTTSETNQPV